MLEISVIFLPQNKFAYEKQLKMANKAINSVRKGIKCSVKTPYLFYPQAAWTLGLLQL